LHRLFAERVITHAEFSLFEQRSLETKSLMQRCKLS
jgi:hypothetical protein